MKTPPMKHGNRQCKDFHSSHVALIGFDDRDDEAGWNWDLFSDRFASREDLKLHFLALKNYRNPLGHAREMDIIPQKQGEAAFGSDGS